MIRAADHPAGPGHPSRPSAAGRPAEDQPADVYIYRDTGDADPAATAAAHQPDERDASYWYDLPGTGTGTGGAATGSAPALAETRGPFEPLVSSGGPRPESATPASATPVGVPEPAPAPDSPAARIPPNDAGTQHPAPGRTSKLEEIREFYLTAEAIGEQNVDKHFDHLLAQQRELISEYFKQSPAAQAEADHAPAHTPLRPGEPAGPEATPPEATPEDGHGASVIAEHPRAW